jgi:hypothetical protein
MPPPFTAPTTMIAGILNSVITPMQPIIDFLHLGSDKAAAIAEVGRDAATASAETAQRLSLAATERAAGSTEAAIDGVTKQINKTVDTIEKGVIGGQGSLQRFMNSMKDSFEKFGISVANNLIEYGQWALSTQGLMTILFFLIALFAFFGYIKDICLWSFDTVACLIEKATNFKACFFWYILDIIFEILYLPIRFLLWLADRFDICLGREIHDRARDMRDDIDCFIYDNYGFHIFRYPHSEMKRCYKCKFRKFPSIAAHFNAIETSSAEDFFKSFV